MVATKKRGQMWNSTHTHMPNKSLDAIELIIMKETNSHQSGSYVNEASHEGIEMTTNIVYALTRKIETKTNVAYATTGRLHQT